MEHPCDKCGATVEDGIAFCPQCSAPQIRVGGEESVWQAEPASDLGYGPIVSPGATAIRWSQALPSAALAGLIAAFLMFIPLGAFGLAMIAAGVLAVWFYRRREPASHLTPSMGAHLGVVSGSFGFGIFAIFTALEVLVFHRGGELRAAMLESVQQAAARSADPQAQQIVEYLKTPAGLALIMGLGLGLVLVLFLLLSSLGGAVGAAWLWRKDRM